MESKEKTPIIKKRKNIDEEIQQLTVPIIDHVSLVTEQQRTDEELKHVQNELRRLIRFIKRLRKENN